MVDSALDDFLKRFGDNDPNKFKTQNQKRTIDIEDRPSAFSSELTEGQDKLGMAKDTLDSAKQIWGKDIDLPEGISSPATVDKGKGLAQSLTGDNLSQGKGILSTKKMGAGDYADVAIGAAQLINNAGGAQFDTSADGDGVGKAGGAIMSGAATGFKAGMATGNPLIAAGGALVGGLTSTFAHTAAMKKWRKNQKIANLKENALEKAKRQQETDMENGLESMETLKGLRQKQLGILS